LPSLAITRRHSPHEAPHASSHNVISCLPNPPGQVFPHQVGRLVRARSDQPVRAPVESAQAGEGAVSPARSAARGDSEGRHSGG